MVKLPQPNLYPPLPRPFFLSLIFTIVFFLYLLNLNPALFRNDTPETITACVTLGVAHPPGYPLFSLMGRLFSFIAIGNPAFTLNLFSSFLSALGVCLFAANLWVLLLLIEPDSTNRRTPFVALATLTGSLAFALSNNYWSCSLSAKGGVYILQMAADLALLLSILQIARTGKPEDVPAPKFYFPFFLFSIGFINHWPTQILLIPALYFISLKPMKAGPRKKTTIEPKVFFIIASLFLLVLSLYLYLPLRSNLDPGLNFGDPNALQRFISSVLRRNYAHQETLLSAGPSALSTIAEKGAYILHRLWSEFHPLACPFFLLGAAVLLKKKRYLVPFALLILTVISAGLFYLIVPPIDFWHLDDHLLTLNWAFGLLASAGLHSTLLWINRRYFPRFAPFPKACFFFALSAGLPLLIFARHISVNNQKNEFLYYGYGLSGLKSMERKSIYFAESDYDYFSMLYLKLVENKRNDIVLLLTPFLSNPCQVPLIQKQQPYHIRSGSPLAAKETGEELFFTALKKGAIDRTFYCAFSNGPFEKMYLQHFSSFSFKPSGILIQCRGGGRPAGGQDLVPPLNDFWKHYLRPGKRGSNPISGLLFGLCSYPYTNAAYYLELRGDFTYWDWFYDKALDLIQIKNWLAEEWSKKGEGNRLAGKSGEALGDFEESALEYLNDGQPGQAKTSLQKALAIDPNNQNLKQILGRMETTP